MRKEKLNSTELDLSVEDEFNIDECYPYRVCQFVPICLQRDKNLDPESEMEAWKGIPILNSILVRNSQSDIRYYIIIRFQVITSADCINGYTVPFSN